MVTAFLRGGAFCATMALCAFGWTPSAQAQSNASNLVAEAQKKAEEINEVLRALQSSDPNTQYALLKILLEEKDPALVRIGREFALFSTNPVVQNMAIVSVFETNPQVRMNITGGTGLESYGWVEHVGGVATETTASAMLSTQTFNGTCWATRNDTCRFFIRGLNVQYNYSFNSWKAQANLTLGPDGVLRGPIFMNTGRAQASIDLKE